MFECLQYLTGTENLLLQDGSQIQAPLFEW